MVYIERYGSKGEAEEEAKVLKELELISDYTIKELEEKTKTATDDGKYNIKGYNLRVSSLKDKANAEKMIDILKNSGHNALYRHETVPGKGKWYRVYIEGYRSKEEAEKEAKKLMESGQISDYVIMGAGEKTPTGSHDRRQDTEFFFLHVNSFKNKINAEKDVQRLKTYGHKAFLVSEEVSGESWFRVYIGSFDNEKIARKVGSELRGKGIISYFKPIEINKDIMKE